MAEAVETDVRPYAPRPVYVPSLRECCVNILAKYRHGLGDVGYLDVQSLRGIAWHCSPDQLAHIEDETLVGSDRNLEWYTWHLWKRHVRTAFGDSGLQAPALESEQPVDYEPPRGIDDEPGDYRTLYEHCKTEMEQRTAAARERIAAATQLVMEAKESRKAKMIDKLIPAKRARGSSSAGGRGGSSSSASLTSAYLHKPRANSRSSVLSKPGAQLKLLSELGLVKKAPPRSTTAVRVIKPPPLPSAAVGHSSSLAGAALLSKATGGQLGTTARGVGAAGGGGRVLHVAAQPPQAAARAAAVAAAAAAATAGAPSKASITPGKRPADGPPFAASPTSKVAAAGRTGGGGATIPSRPDPRVMFPRQAPPSSSPGQSKFAVPTARPVTAPASTAGGAVPRGAGAAGGRAGAAAVGPRPLDDL